MTGGLPVVPPRPEGPLSPAYRLVTLGIVGLITLIAFEALAVSTAMPVVATDLGAVRSYGLAFSLFLTMSLLGTVLAGGWSDARGARGPALVGLALFAGGLVVCGAATSFEVLLAGRVVSGAGAGFTIVAIYVVVAGVYPDHLRPRVFGLLATAWVVPSLLGPPVAGWLATEVTWRAVFLAVPPAVVLVLLGLARPLSRLPAPAGAPGGAGRRGDRVVRGVGLALGATALQWAAQDLEDAGAKTVAGLAVGALLVAVSLPGLVPPGTLRAARGLPSVIAVRGLFTASFFGAETYVPLMLVSERGLSPGVAGLMLTGGAVGWALGSWTQSRPGLRLARHQLLGVGGGIVAVAVLLLAPLVLHAVPPLAALPVWTLGGLGMGIAMSSTSVLTLDLSPAGEQGRSSASLQLADALGSVVGIGTAGAVFAALHEPGSSDAATFAGMWVGLSCVGALSVVVGLRARRRTTGGVGTGAPGRLGTSPQPLG